MNEYQVPADDSAFSAFFLEDTSTVDIELPNGEPMLYQGQPVSVRVYGPATQVFADAKTALDREAAKNMMAALGAKQKSKDQADKEADLKFLVAVTAGLNNFPFPGGAAAAYADKRLAYLPDQVRKHLADLGNFFPGKAKT
jgi:hypothetical protein